MARSNPRFATIFIVLLLAFAIVGCGIAVNFIVQVPAQAEQLFGSPSVHLSGLQRYTIAYTLIRQQQNLLTPLSHTGETRLFSIAIDEPTDLILERMQTDGLIADKDLVRDYLIYTGLDTQLQSGDFYLSPAMTAIEIINSLLDSTPLFVTVSVLPGWRLEELAYSLPTTGLSITPDEFIAAASRRYNSLSIMQEIPIGVPLEGYFPPGAYEVERTITAQQLVRFLLKEFDAQLSYELKDGFARQGLTIHQAITLASIIQREAILDEEMPIIASVFYNRLKISMKLETDPTVQYALGYNTAQNSWWTTPLSYADLEYDSVYNTYLYAGLPPAPISNPSLAALQAVAFPAQTLYYYFRAACDDSGRHHFSETYEEHLENACQ